MNWKMQRAPFLKLIAGEENVIAARLNGPVYEQSLLIYLHGWCLKLFILEDGGHHTSRDCGCMSWRHLETLD